MKFGELAIGDSFVYAFGEFNLRMYEKKSKSSAHPVRVAPVRNTGKVGTTDEITRFAKGCEVWKVIR